MKEGCTVKFKVKKVSKLAIGKQIFHNGDVVDLPDKYVGCDFLEPLEVPKAIVMPKPQIETKVTPAEPTAAIAEVAETPKEKPKRKK